MDHKSRMRISDAVQELNAIIERLDDLATAVESSDGGDLVRRDGEIHALHASIRDFLHKAGTPGIIKEYESLYESRRERLNSSLRDFCSLLEELRSNVSQGKVPQLIDNRSTFRYLRSVLPGWVFNGWTIIVGLIGVSGSVLAILKALGVV